MTASKQQIREAIQKGMDNAHTQNVPLWLGATDEVLNLLVEEGECFSSGSIAAYLRTFNPNLKFSVTSHIGEHIRDRFSANTMPVYVHDDGTVSPMEQVPRVTQGIARTPPGTGVFVYAPSYQEGMGYDFEVDIPVPGTPLPLEPDGLPAIPQQPLVPASHFIQLAPRVAQVNLMAVVHKNRRCYIPRSAFEELLHETKSGLKGGDPVYVTVDADEAIVSLDRTPGSQAYQLVATRGVVQFSHPVTPFTIGDTFPIVVEGGARRLVVALK